MSDVFLLRNEQNGDEDSIRMLTDHAFAPMPFSDGTEPAIIDALRNAGELALSLVAVLEGEIVGQITFSKVTIDGAHDGWFGLGPVAVDPARQGSGIGSALVREGLARLQAQTARGCVLIGNPAYYSRFGFQAAVGLSYGDIDPSFVQSLVFAGGNARSGTLRYSPAFEAAASG